MCFPTLIKFNKFEPVPCVHKNRAKQTHPILSSLELLQQIQENRIEFQKKQKSLATAMLFLPVGNWNKAIQNQFG